MRYQLSVKRNLYTILAAALMLFPDCSWASSVPLSHRPVQPLLVSDPIRLDDANPSPAPSTCVKYRGRVRYSLGYDHLVDLENSCQKRVVCSVKTNVNPQEQQVHLDVGETSTVVTYIGSPAREFTPQVNCRYV